MQQLKKKKNAEKYFISRVKGFHKSPDNEELNRPQLAWQDETKKSSWENLYSPVSQCPHAVSLHWRVRSLNKS